MRFHVEWSSRPSDPALDAGAREPGPVNTDFANMDPSAFIGSGSRAEPVPDLIRDARPE
jgi:hypothetical protein